MRRNIEFECDIPTKQDVFDRFPRMGTLRSEKMQFLYDLLLRPECYFRSTVVLEIGRPPVIGVEQMLLDEWEKQPERPDWNQTKQAAGAIICVLMEANGYEKTISLPVGNSRFTTAHTYERATPKIVRMNCPRCGNINKVRRDPNKPDFYSCARKHLFRLEFRDGLKRVLVDALGNVPKDYPVPDSVEF